MSTRYLLVDSGHEVDDKTEKDDAIAEAHRLADEGGVNIAVIQRTDTLLAFIRSSHTYQGPEPMNEHHVPETVADALELAFEEGLRIGMAAENTHGMTVEEYIDYRWRESEAFDFHRALIEVS